MYLSNYLCSNFPMFIIGEFKDTFIDDFILSPYKERHEIIECQGVRCH